MVQQLLVGKGHTARLVHKRPRAGSEVKPLLECDKCGGAWPAPNPYKRSKVNMVTGWKTMGLLTA